MLRIWKSVGENPKEYKMLFDSWVRCIPPHPPVGEGGGVSFEGSLAVKLIAKLKLLAVTTTVTQPRIPRVPCGVLTLKSPLPCPPVENLNAPFVASMTTLPVPLFGS
jgi:hypothetical protein